MSPLTVAPATGRHLVLHPTRAALDAGHDVLGGGFDQSGRNRSTTPDAGGTVTLEDRFHPLTAIELAALRAAGVTAPMILTSGYAEDEAAIGSESAAVAGYIPKPYSQHDLLAALAAATAS